MDPLSITLMITGAAIGLTGGVIQTVGSMISAEQQQAALDFEQE